APCSGPWFAADSSTGDGLQARTSAGRDDASVRAWRAASRGRRSANLSSRGSPLEGTPGPDRGPAGDPVAADPGNRVDSGEPVEPGVAEMVRYKDHPVVDEHGAMEVMQDEEPR